MNEDTPAIATLGKAASLSSDEPEHLSLEQHAADVPAELYKGVPSGDPAALRNLLQRLKTSELAARRSESQDSNVSAALETAEQIGISAQVEILKKQVRELAQEIERWRHNASLQDMSFGDDNRDVADTFGGAQANAAHSLEAPANVTGMGKKINVILEKLSGDYLAMVRAEHQLKIRVKQGGPAKDKYAEAVAVLHGKVAPLDDAIAQFHTLKLTIAFEELTLAHRRRGEVKKQQQEMDAAVEKLNKSLRIKRAWTRLTLRRSSRAEQEVIATEISRLTLQKELMSEAIPTKMIFKWLDAIIEATLDPISNKMAQKRIRGTRELFFPLLKPPVRPADDQIASTSAQSSETDGETAKAMESSDGSPAPEQLLKAFFRRKLDDRGFLFRGNQDAKHKQLESLYRNMLSEFRRRLGGVGNPIDVNTSTGRKRKPALVGKLAHPAITGRFKSLSLSKNRTG